jgi:Predicted signal transduction protein with a C-terminal ATPase domain
MKRNRLVQWFEKQKLGKKIFYTFILATLIPILLVQGIMLRFTSQNLKSKMDELMLNQLRQISERIDLTLDIYTNLVYQACIDNIIIDSVNILMDVDAKEKELAHREIYTRLQQYSAAAEGIQCISIVCADGQQVTYDFGRASSVESIWKDYDDLRETQPYQSAQTSSNMIITPTTEFQENQQEYRVFHISKKVYDFRAIEKGPIATVVMSIDERVLNAVCNSVPLEDLSQEYSINFITDESGHVLTYVDPFYAGISINEKFSVEKFVQATGRMKDKDLVVNKYKNEELDWIFYTVYDKNYMLKDIVDTQNFAIALGLVVVVFSLILIIYIVKMIEKSIGSIIAGIQAVQRGDLTIQVNVDSEDEMGQIADNFNTMTQKVQGLLEEVTDATQKKKEAEIRALEAQINPHFLYNTLDSINWMAIEHGEAEISTMLRNLGVILRDSIDKSNRQVTIDSLADWLNKYVSLQQMRFNHIFKFELRVDENIRMAKIYNLLLQPFVENSIVHGFKGMKAGGKLHIDIMESEDHATLNIIIEDNGQGMLPERVRKYNNPEEAIEDDGRSIGLQNAFSRMRMYYGEDVSWNVSSILEMGTVITLKIPIV